MPHDKVSIHKCLLFAEEFLKVGRFYGHKYLVLKSAIQPAEVEFLGHELDMTQRAAFNEGIVHLVDLDELKYECAAFDVAHVTFHVVNEEENEH